MVHCGFCTQEGHNITKCRVKQCGMIYGQTKGYINFLEDMLEVFGEPFPTQMFKDIAKKIPTRILKLLIHKISGTTLNHKKNDLAEEFAYHFTTNSYRTHSILIRLMGQEYMMPIVNLHTQAILEDDVRVFTYCFKESINEYYNKKNAILPIIIVKRYYTNAISYNVELKKQNPESPTEDKYYEEEEEECPICYNLYKTDCFVKTGCHHAFCINCVQSLLGANLEKKHVSCPMCRSEVDKFVCDKNDIYKEMDTFKKNQNKIKTYIVATNVIQTHRLFCID